LFQRAVQLRRIALQIGPEDSSALCEGQDVLLIASGVE